MTDRRTTEGRIEAFSIAHAEYEYAIYYRRLVDGTWVSDVGEYDENGSIIGENTITVASLEDALKADLDEYVSSITCTGIDDEECLEWLRPLLPDGLDWISINDVGYDLH